MGLFLKNKLGRVEGGEGRNICQGQGYYFEETACEIFRDKLKMEIDFPVQVQLSRADDQEKIM